MGGEKEDNNLISLKEENFEDRLKQLKNLIGEIEEVETEEEINTRKIDSYNELKEKHETAHKIITENFKERKEVLKELHSSVDELRNKIENPKISNDNSFTVSVLKDNIIEKKDSINDLKEVIKLQKKELDKKEDELGNLKSAYFKKNTIFSKEINELNNEKENLKNLMDDLKKIIKNQKNDIFEKEERLKNFEKEFDKFNNEHNIKKIKESLDKKHESIQNLHGITKELTNHYLSKVNHYNNQIKQNELLKEELEKDKAITIQEKDRIISDLKQNLESNSSSLNELKKYVELQKDSISEREKLIEELNIQNKDLKESLQDSNTKAIMYEKISLKSKNDSLTNEELLRDLARELEKHKTHNELHSQKIPELKNQIDNHRKQIDIIKEEYEKRVDRIKEKHNSEIQALVKEQTRNEMNLKSQIYTLNEEIKGINSELIFEKEKQKQFANELSQKMSTLFRPILEDKPIIYNVPNNIREDYELIDNDE